MSSPPHLRALIWIHLGIIWLSRPPWCPALPFNPHWDRLYPVPFLATLTIDQTLAKSSSAAVPAPPHSASPSGAPLLTSSGVDPHALEGPHEPAWSCVQQWCSEWEGQAFVIRRAAAVSASPDDRTMRVQRHINLLRHPYCVPSGFSLFRCYSSPSIHSAKTILAVPSLDVKRPLTLLLYGLRGALVTEMPASLTA